MTACTLVASRFAAQDTIINAVNVNIDGDQSLLFELPAGYGDAMLNAWFVGITSIDVAAADPEKTGPSLTIVDPASSTVDIVSNSNIPWQQVAGGVGTSVFRATENLRRSILWRSNESVFVRFAEVDTDATPTADLTVVFRITRLRSP